MHSENLLYLKDDGQHTMFNNTTDQEGVKKGNGVRNTYRKDSFPFALLLISLTHPNDFSPY